MTLRTLGLTLALAVSALAGRATAVTWSGATDFQWNTGTNWVGGSPPSKAATDTATFDSTAAAGGTITWATGGTNQPKNTNFSFLAGAPAFTFSGASAINNGSNGITYTTAAGVTTNQVFNSVAAANFTVTLNGSGGMTFNTLSGANLYDDINVNTFVANINDAAAVLTIGNFAQNRGYALTKSGAGTLAITGTIELGYGFKNTTPFAFISSTIKTSGVSAGTIDLSLATANLESHLDGVEALAAGVKYTLVDYANATLIGAGTTGFASVIGDVPAGWGLVNNTTDKKIYLQQVPEPSSAALLLMGAGALATRKKRNNESQMNADKRR